MVTVHYNTSALSNLPCKLPFYTTFQLLFSSQTFRPIVTFDNDGSTKRDLGNSPELSTVGGGLDASLGSVLEDSKQK